MRLSDVPLIKQVLESGADDRVYDSLLLAGPVIIAVIGIAGRTLITTGLGLLYVATFVSYLLSRAVRQRERLLPEGGSS